MHYIYIYITYIYIYIIFVHLPVSVGILPQAVLRKEPRECWQVPGADGPVIAFFRRAEKLVACLRSISPLHDHDI